MVPRDTPDDATRRVMDALRRVVRALGASARGASGGAAGRGVSGAQLFVLRQIAAAPGCSIGDLAARTLAGQSTVSGVVARLVKGGFVARVASPADARQAMLELTARGRRAIAGASSTAQERLARGLESMSPAARRTLAGALEEWLGAAGLTGEPATMFFEDRASATRARGTRPRRRA